jgi:hypothetical protein
MSKHRVFWLVFFGGILFFAVAIVWYTQRALTPHQPTSQALMALKPSPTLQVQATEYGWLFLPQGQVRGGLVFYPGGLVEPPAYAPVLRRIAEAGYRVALLRVHLNLAITQPDRARLPIAEAPELPWAVGGHSLGGVVAANFAASPDQTQGRPQVRALLLWAAYPQHDLSAKNLPTLALFGEKDGVLNREELEVSLTRFPAGSIIQTIAGLNHAGFGAYGSQRSDNPATIPPEAGWEEIARRSVAFLDQALGQP